MGQDLWIKMANLIFELEKKMTAQPPLTSVRRNIDRMKTVLEEAGFTLLNPLGETYNETRTDLEASIAGSGNGALKIVDVIKPVVYSNQDGRLALLQKGVVIVGNNESR